MQSTSVQSTTSFRAFFLDLLCLKLARSGDVSTGVLKWQLLNNNKGSAKIAASVNYTLYEVSLLYYCWLIAQSHG